MASTKSSTTLASVAPQENSTWTLMFLSVKYFFVKFTSSVEILFPSISARDCIGESSLTTNTHRASFGDNFEYTRSCTTTTSDSFSIIQSLPVSPRSRVPSATYLDISCALTSVQEISP